MKRLVGLLTALCLLPSLACADTVLQMPWFTKVPGYLSRFFILNSGSSAATYSVAVYTESGNSVVLKPGASAGTIPARKQFVLQVDDLIQSFAGNQRGTAVFTIQSNAADITGIYNLVQPSTGAISNVSLVEPGITPTQSSVLVGPWFTLNGSYRGAFILTNNSSADVSATYSFLVAGGVAATPLQGALTIPARGQRVLDANALASIVGTPQAGVVFSLNAPASVVKGTYRIYNVQTGAASSSELLTPSTSPGESTILTVPWFSVVGGYDSRFILTNRGINPVGYTIDVLPESGNAITTGTLSGTIPSAGQVVLPALSVLTSTSGPTRAAATFSIQGPPSDIDGIYQIVSQSTGAISNTVMARTFASGAGTAKLRLPWFSTVSGYISRFALVNRGYSPATFTIEIVPEQGNSVLQQLITTASVPARGQLVLPVADILTGLTTATRAAAELRFSAPDSDVEGYYNIVNPISGTISNTLMVHTPITFGNGTRLIGPSMPPGRYRSVNAPDAYCYWARLSDTTGSFGSIIANDGGGGVRIAEVLPTDNAFESRHCAPWYQITGPVTTSLTSPFSIGRYIVGVDIAPGRYRSINAPEDSCYWARLSDATGSFVSIIANDGGGGVRVAEVLPTDNAFESSHCTQWYPITGPVTASPTSPFSDGRYVVGVDIAPGVWQSNGTGAGCYWARIKDFTEDNNIINNYFGSAPAVVTILMTDVGFDTADCGTWSRVQ